MKNLSAKILLLSLVSTFSSMSFAVDWFEHGDGMNEISLSSTDAAAAFGSGVSTFGLTGGYMRKLEESIAVGGEASWVSVSYKDYSASSLSLLAIGHFAFDYHDFNNSYFGLAGLGIGSTLAKYSTSEKSENKVAFRLGGGKRTHITKSIYWRPEIYFEKVDGFDGTLVLRMINLTMIW